MYLARLIAPSLVSAVLAACVPATGGYATPLLPPISGPGSEAAEMTAPSEKPTSGPPTLGPPGSRPRSPAFDQAQAARNSTALILFLIHHRDDPALASVRDVLANRRQPDSRATLLATAGPEAEVVGAFDTARLASTAAAWQGFLARYPGHILASEVGYFSQR